VDKFLQQLADRLQVPDSEIITADEIKDWPTGKLNELVESGVLEEIQHAKGLVCNECEENCFIEPNIRTNPDTGAATGVFVCARNPDVGRIEIDLNRLRQWRINNTKLAKLGYGTEQDTLCSEIPYEIGLLKEIADKLENWADERKTGFQDKIAEERQNENRYKTIGDFLKERDTFSRIEELSPIASYFALPDLSDELAFAVKSFQFNENFAPATMLVEIQNELYHKNIEIVKLATEVSEHLDSYEPESLEYKSLLLQVRTSFAVTIPDIAGRIRKIADMTKKKLVSSTRTQPAETKRSVSLVSDLVNALKQADELLELWDIGNKDSDAFNNGWHSPDGRCCPKKSLEKAASYLKQMGDNDAAKHIEAETKTLSERVIEFDYSYDGEPIPPVKKDVFDPLRNYLLVLIQKFEASDKTHLGSAKIKADNWEQVTIEVVDDDTIKYKVNDKKWERANYTELGFLDRRKHLPNNLWPRFLSLAERIRPMSNPPNIKPKDIDRIRSTLRNFFGLQKIPIQYDSKNQKYSCMFKFYDNRDW